MEPEEQIYVNLEELSVAEKTEEDSWNDQSSFRRPAGSEAVGGDGESEQEAGRWSAVEAAAVCLMLLSLLLVTAVAAVAAVYSRDFRQLSTDLANRTAERLQLLVRYQNLSHERDQLQTRLNRVLKNVEMCPGRWKKFGCSCYFLSPTTSSWDSSRRQCLNQGAQLVAISSREEMVFLNKLGSRLRFWIGLSQTSGSSTWKWTDGRAAADTYWQYGQPQTNRNTYGYLIQRCAAFNSFTARSSAWTFHSWTKLQNRLLHLITMKLQENKDSAARLYFFEPIKVLLGGAKPGMQ